MLRLHGPLTPRCVALAQEITTLDTNVRQIRAGSHLGFKPEESPNPRLSSVRLIKAALPPAPGIVRLRAVLSYCHERPTLGRDRLNVDGAGHLELYEKLTAAPGAVESGRRDS